VRVQKPNWRFYQNFENPESKLEVKIKIGSFEKKKLKLGPKVLLKSKNPPTLVKTLLDFASVYRKQIVQRKSR
jgi:hypothetical protein